MRRTRKWAYVAQEARRLADLGLSAAEISRRLELNRSTVCRWMATGKVRDTRVSAGDRPVVRGPSSSTVGGAELWAAAVRAAYALDVTDEQLVDLATQALAVAKDMNEPASVRLSAMARFQGLVKQLALVARAPVTEAARAPAPPPPPPPLDSRPDPRGHLMLQ